MFILDFGFLTEELKELSHPNTISLFFFEVVGSLVGNREGP
jgi:hypothetical protein